MTIEPTCCNAPESLPSGRSLIRPGACELPAGHGVAAGSEPVTTMRREALGGAAQGRAAADGLAGGPLGNKEDKEYPPRPTGAMLTWMERTFQWRVSSLRSVRACGRVVRNAGMGGTGTVTVRRFDRGNGGTGLMFGGLCACGSGRCARCADVIAHERADGLARALRWWLPDGPGNTRWALFLTLTVQHSREDSVASMIDAVSQGRRALTAGAPYRGNDHYEGDRIRFGIAGMAHTIETTWSAINGFHVHLHTLILLEHGLCVADVIALGRRLFSRWQRTVNRYGYETDMAHGGFSLEPVNGVDDCAERLSGYMTKDTANNAAMELLNGQGKHGRGHGSMTYFDILARLSLNPNTRRFWFVLPEESMVVWPDEKTLDVVDAVTGEIIDEYPVNGELRLLRVMHEMETAFKGRRMMTMSQRPRKHTGDDAGYKTMLDALWGEFHDHMGDDPDDVEIANRRDLPGMLIASIPADEWRQMYVRHPSLIYAYIRRNEERNHALKVVHENKNTF